MSALVTLLFLIIQACATTQVHYKNYKVYQLVLSNEQQYNLFQNFENNPHVTFANLQCAATKPVSVMISPEFQSEFETKLSQLQTNFTLLADDVERTIAEERLAQQKIATRKGEISFDKYYRYSEIQDYLDQLAIKYPRLVTIENYGQSYENRNLTLIRISTGGIRKKPIIFVDAGIHAMEWIGPAQALYIINQLLENPRNRHLIRTVDWIVVPLLNPDGYEYSHTTNRFWRGTRSKGKVCDGVDPNRNFDFHWMEAGSSTDECSYFYAGPSAFSEPETLALSKTIERHASRIELYLTFHGPAQCVLYPYGYTPTLPDNAQELETLATEVARAIYAVNGTDYMVGNSYNTLNPAAGSSRDWAHGAAGIRLSYTMELPPGGITGFDVPPERILGVVEEMFEGVKVFHTYVKRKLPRV